MSSSLLREAKKGGARGMLEDREQVRARIWDRGIGTGTGAGIHGQFRLPQEVDSRRHHVSQ